MSLPEPWLRGPIPDLHPVAAHLIYTFTQCREEVAKYTLGLENVWLTHPPLTSVGFHLAHIAGSVNRLTTYLRDESLTAEQLADFKTEGTLQLTLAELLGAIDTELMRCEILVRGIDPATYGEPRFVGRQRLPTTVGGLIIHISEHTQRHLGQLVLTAKLVR